MMLIHFYIFSNAIKFTKIYLHAFFSVIPYYVNFYQNKYNFSYFCCIQILKILSAWYYSALSIFIRSQTKSSQLLHIILFHNVDSKFDTTNSNIKNFIFWKQTEDLVALRAFRLPDHATALYNFVLFLI